MNGFESYRRHGGAVIFHFLAVPKVSVFLVLRDFRLSLFGLFGLFVECAR